MKDIFWSIGKIVKEFAKLAIFGLIVVEKFADILMYDLKLGGWLVTCIIVAIVAVYGYFRIDQVVLESYHIGYLIRKERKERNIRKEKKEG